jgi:hypothetical protein
VNPASIGKISPLLPILLYILLFTPGEAFPKNHGDYLAVPGLLDIRTTRSDGKHSIEEVVRLARSRGFKVLCLNDHHTVAVAYGIPPFRNILSYKKEFPSIMTGGADQYIEEVRRVAAKYPDMIIIPGCITSPFYYWTGSWLRGDLTLHQYDRRILIVGFDDPEDYKLLPSVGNRLSFQYTRRLIPGLALFSIPLCIGLLLLRWKGRLRVAGAILVIFSGLAIMDYNPLRSSLYSPYGGEQGIGPFQEVIDFVNRRGGLAFWNYPEQRSGVRKHGPIFVDTPPYPEVLRQSSEYTGFAAIYGDNITATDPGKEWDRVLNEYCRGQRGSPPWGISTADFHEDGRLGLRLGAFPTTFLIKSFTKGAVLEAIRKGRMYCSRGDGAVWPKLDDFQAIGSDGQSAVMGGILTTREPPLIKFTVSFQGGKKGSVKMFLIRGGTLLRSFEGETPLEVRLTDGGLTPGELTYYRLMDSKKHLTSNPIFVRYKSKI